MQLNKPKRQRRGTAIDRLEQVRVKTSQLLYVALLSAESLKAADSGGLGSTLYRQ